MSEARGLPWPTPAASGRAGAEARDAGRRFAVGAFAARVFNAGLGFATQILLARWMGAAEFGLYASVWVWLLTLGGIASLGLPVAAQKLVPDYALRGDLDGLRGFLAGSPWLAAGPAAILALLGAAAIWFWLDPANLYGPTCLVALAILPLYCLTDIQTGIARAYDDADLGLTADYVVRPLLILAFAAALFLAGHGGTAFAVMTASLAAAAITCLGQALLLRRRLASRVPAGPARMDLRRWSEVGWPLLAVTGLTLLLASTDLFVLQLFVGPEQVAVYFAATKIVAVASFVAYGVASSSAHRFAAHQATGDRESLAALAADTVRWTFWPTLAVAAVLAALAQPLLALFGPGFATGAPVVAILGLGLAAAAVVGPADRALAMADQGRWTAVSFAAALAANLALCLVLVPAFGLVGAAIGSALALALRAGLLFFAVRRQLGLTMLAFAPAAAAADRAPSRPRDVEAALIGLDEAEAIAPAWRNLSERTLEPNPFYGPEIALAALRHLPRDAGGRVLVAWRGADSERRLVGLLPLVSASGRWLNPLPVRRAGEFYGTLSTPLLDPDRPAETLAALLAAADQAGIRGVILPFLHAAGPVAESLGELARQGFATAPLGCHQRAFLKSPLGGTAYLRATLEGRRRKEAERQRRRLGELGEVTFAVARHPDDVAGALQRFLDLEASGWKGRRGTALAYASGAAAFMRAASSSLAGHGAFRVATLSVGGSTVAAGLVAIANRRAFYLKTAYDETFARYSPGLLLTLDLTAHLLDDPEIDDADSIAVEGHPMIDRIWTERLPIGARLMSTRPGGQRFVAMAAFVERLRETIISRLKRVRERASARRAGHAGDAPGRPAGRHDPS